jgi:group I intron endonuclease
MVAGVYWILNLVNGKVYIGSSVDVENRLQNHKKDLIAGKHRNPYLQRAWNK